MTINTNIKRTLGRAYSRLLASYASFGAMLKVKLGRPAVTHILGCVALLGRRVNLSVVKVVITTVATFWRLQKKGGIKFLVIYLKGCASILQQSIGGQRLYDLTPFGARIGRTHGGLPNIIPALHRARIRGGDTWTIRFWMTLFGIYRILEFPGKVKLNTITDDSNMNPSLIPLFSQFVVNHFWPVVKARFHVNGSVTDALWSEEGDGPLEFMKGLRAKPFLISKSGPSIIGGNVPGGAQNTSPAAILASAYTWLRSPLYQVLTNWCKMTGNIWVLNRIESWAKELWVWEDSLPLSSGGPKCPFEATDWLGRLGFKEEPAGKVRVFAMVDPWTQWLMDRLHKAIFKLLATFPQDGTFDQLKPIDRLFAWQESNRSSNGRKPPLFSFDLSSATDRIPIVLQKILLSPILTSWGAELWASLMVGRDYHTPKRIKLGGAKSWQILSETGKVRYSTGQPMGALSSWAMLALVHHAIVQWAAVTAGVITPGKGWYSGYAILGDDVVIAGSAVAKQYLKLMKHADVGVGAHKSLVSRVGTAIEFAKRTFRNGVNVSGAPFAEFVVCRQSLAGLLELVRKYQLPFGRMLSVLGYGYRAKANASKRLMSIPKRMRNYILAFYGPGGPAYAGLKSWLPMRSVTSTYSTAMDRVSSLVTSFFEREVKLALEVLDGWLPLIAEARRLGTVYRDREHYGTVSRTAGQKLVITNPDLGFPVDGDSEGTTDLSSIEVKPMRAPTLEEYNASLERAYMADRDPNKSPLVLVSEVPETAPLIPTVSSSWMGEGRPLTSPIQGSDPRQTVIHPGIEISTPQSIVDSLNETVYREAFLDTAINYRDLRTKLEELEISSLDWEGIESLWTSLREIETELGALPFPKNIHKRASSEGKVTDGKAIKRWYRHSGLFRATVTRSSEEKSEVP